MQQENLTLSGKTVKCLVCGENSALEEEYEGITSHLCVSCGYTSNSTMKKNSKEILMSPKTIQKLKVWDKDRQVYWIPSVINLPSRGIVFPEEYGDKLMWSYVPIEEIPENERIDYPIGDGGKFHTHRLNPDKMQKYEKFSDAIKQLGAIISDDSLLQH